MWEVPVKLFFLLLSLLGAIIPYIFFGKFILLEGVNIPLFVENLFVNNPARGFTTDILISSLVFWGFVIKTKWKPLFPFVLINLFIGLSCALPLYLYFGYKKNKF